VRSFTDPHYSGGSSAHVSRDDTTASSAEDKGGDAERSRVARYINGVPDLTAFKAGRPDLEDGDDPATGLQDGSHSAGEGGGGSMAGIDVGITFLTGGVRSNDNDPVEGAGPVLNGDHRARS
jgi:hypothetical protein